MLKFPELAVLAVVECGRSDKSPTSEEENKRVAQKTRWVIWQFEFLAGLGFRPGSANQQSK